MYNLPFELRSEEICPTEPTKTSCEEKENDGIAGLYSNVPSDEATDENQAIVDVDTNAKTIEDVRTSVGEGLIVNNSGHRAALLEEKHGGKTVEDIRTRVVQAQRVKSKDKFEPLLIKALKDHSVSAGNRDKGVNIDV